MTESEKSKCESWVKAHAMSWQVLSRSQWRYIFHEKTLVRFVEDASMREDEVRLLLEYLSSDACVATLHLYDQSIDASWKPIRAWYEVSNQSHGKIHAVRLYHGLRTDLGAGGDGPYLVEDGCAYKVSLTYYWKQPSVIAVPSSSSGVSYRITGLMRNDDTGLYTYALEKRTRVQQDIPKFLSRETAFETVEREAHLGVKAGRNAGLQASVKNGRITTRDVSKNSDCTTDVHNTVTTGKKVSGAVVEYSRSLRSTTKSVTDRNQDAPLNGDGMKVGERRATRITEFGKHDNTKTTVSAVEVGKLQESEVRTVFETRHSKLEAKKREIPAEVTAQDAENGVVERIDVKRNEDGVTCDFTTSKTEEKGRTEAVVEVQRTLRGTRRTVVDRNQPAPPDVDALNVGERASTRVTDGNLHDNTRSSFEAKASAGGGAQTLSRRCSASGESHTDTVTQAVALDESGNPVGTIGGNGHVVSDVNVERTQSWRKNEDGQTADVETTTRVHHTLRGNQTTRTGGGLESVTKRTENSPTAGTLSSGSWSGAVARASSGVQTPIDISNVHHWLAEDTSGAAANDMRPGVNKDVQESSMPNGHGSFTVTSVVTKFPEVDSGEKEWTDADGNRHVQRVYQNKPRIIMPEVEGDGPRHVSFSPSGHGSWNGAYSFVEPVVYNTYSDANLIIDADVDVTYRRGRKNGHWSYTSLNVTNHVYTVWSYVRVARGRYRYVNMTYAAAVKCAEQLKKLFTRNTYESVWQDEQGQPHFGQFAQMSGGIMRSTGVHIYRIARDIYGVRVDVNEIEELLDRNVYTPDSLFPARRYYL